MEELVVQGHATFWISGDNLLCCKLSDLEMGNTLDSKTALLYIDAIKRLSGKERLPLLIDLREARGTFSNKAAKLLSKSLDSMPFVVCEAFVVNSLSVKLLVQAYKRIYKTRIPYQIFNNLAAAREYCHSQKGGSLGPLGTSSKMRKIR